MESASVGDGLVEEGGDELLAVTRDHAQHNDPVLKQRIQLALNPTPKLVVVN